MNTASPFFRALYGDDAPSYVVLFTIPENEVRAEPADSLERGGATAERADLARTPEGGRNHRLNVAAFALARFVAAGKADASSVVRELAHASTQAGA